MPDDKVGALLQQLQEGVLALRNTDNFKAYLRAGALFHNYSFRNALLILTQRPDATHVAGYNAWRALGRHVMRGERAIRIIAPCIVRRNDDARTEEIIGFKSTNVFDVSQTDGDPLPQIPVTQLSGNIKDYAIIYQALTEVAAPYVVSLEDLRGRGRQAYGFCDPSQHRIVIDYALPEAQIIKTFVHELAHSVMHDDCSIPRRDAEVQAEATAFILSEHLGIDASDYSFGYITSWSADKTYDDLCGTLASIQSTAHMLICKIDVSLAAVRGRRQEEKASKGQMALEDKLQAAQKAARQKNELGTQGVMVNRTAGADQPFTPLITRR